MKTLKKIIKGIGVAAGVLVLLIIVTYLIIYFKTEARINKVYNYTIPDIKIPMDKASITQGAHLFHIRGCGDCHGKNLAGKIYKDDGMLLRLTVPNITKGPGGLPAGFSNRDWIRVLRHGVDENGKSLWLMPAHETAQLSSDDMGKLIAFCKSRPPASSPVNKLHEIGPIGRVVIMLDQAVILPAERINHTAPLTAVTKPEVSAAYGKYLTTGCQGCHRPNLQGGGPLAPGYPPVPNITSSGEPGGWNEPLFIKTIRTGVTPEGKKLRPEFMPWKNMTHFTDDELKAIFMYLKSLPGKA